MRMLSKTFLPPKIKKEQMFEYYEASLSYYEDGYQIFFTGDIRSVVKSSIVPFLKLFPHVWESFWKFLNTTVSYLVILDLNHNGCWATFAKSQCVPWWPLWRGPWYSVILNGLYITRHLSKERQLYNYNLRSDQDWHNNGFEYFVLYTTISWCFNGATKK